MTTRTYRAARRASFRLTEDIENPVNPDGHKVTYLWEDILQPDNLSGANQRLHPRAGSYADKVYDPEHRRGQRCEATQYSFSRGTTNST